MLLLNCGYGMPCWCLLVCVLVLLGAGLCCGVGVLVCGFVGCCLLVRCFCSADVCVVVVV